MAEKKSPPQNFMVQILDTEDATWKGIITWTDTGRKENFRSLLEMLRLMDNTMQEG